MKKMAFHLGLLSKQTKVLKDFYRRLLGKDPSFEDSEDYLEFKVSDLAILDIENRKLLEDLQEYKPNKFYLRFEVKNVNETFKKCQENKLKILRGPVVQPYGKIEMYILDPDSNLIQLFQTI